MIIKSSMPFLKQSIYARNDKEGNIFIGASPQDAIKIGKLTDFQIDLLRLLDGGLTVEEVTFSLQEKGHQCDVEDVIAILEDLDRHMLLDDSQNLMKDNGLDMHSNMRYNRQMLLFSALNKDGYLGASEVQQKIQSSHICLLGIGGVGSYVFYGLSAMGIGKLTAVDFDQVELSNLSRQILYWEEDVNRLKTEVAEEKGHLINSNIEFNVINKRIKNVDDIIEVSKGADLIILAADTPRGKIAHWVNEASLITNTPALYIGSAHTTIICGPLVIPGVTADFEDSIPVHTDDDHPVAQFLNSRFTSSLIDPYNSMAAAMGVLEAIKHLTGFSPCQIYNRRWFLDTTTLESHFQEFETKKEESNAEMII